MPREQRTVGRPRGIPRVVGVRDAHRPRRTVERHRPRRRTHRRVRSRTRPRRAPRPRARSRRRRGAAPAAGVAVGAHHDEPAVAGDDHDLVVARPAPTAAEPALGGDDRRAAPSRRSAATTRSVRPSKLSVQASRFPDGDQRGSPTPCERAIIAAVIGVIGPGRRSVTAANGSRGTAAAAAGEEPATRLGPGRQLASGGPALHPGFFMSNPPAPLPRPGDPLRIAFLIYRGNPHCGGQGVYSRHLTRELTELGHSRRRCSRASRGRSPTRRSMLEEVAGLDLYRRENPFRMPWPYEFRTIDDLAEFGIMCTAGFPEPYAFSRRVYKMLRNRRDEFDLVHDNQCLGTGLLGLLRRRLAVRAHAAPPDHRRPRPRPRRRERPVPPAHAAPLVRLPRHADEGRAPGAAPHHRVGELEERHRRADGRRPRHAARRAGRCRPAAVPADARTSSACPAG